MKNITMSVGDVKSLAREAQVANKEKLKLSGWLAKVQKLAAMVAQILAQLGVTSDASVRKRDDLLKRLGKLNTQIEATAAKAVVS